MGIDVACDCVRPNGAHDEKCAHVRHVRSDRYEDDLEIPAALRRARVPKPSEGVFD